MPVITRLPSIPNQQIDGRFGKKELMAYISIFKPCSVTTCFLDYLGKFAPALKE